MQADPHLYWQVEIKDGNLNIVKEGRNQKFRKNVREKTFGAATAGQRSIMYVTERAVFRLIPGKGIELLEVAPGIDLERNLLAHMEFKPIMKKVQLMDSKIFAA